MKTSDEYITMDRDIRCRKCNCAADRVKRRWYERFLLVGAAYTCTWCGRRRLVSCFSHAEADSYQPNSYRPNSSQAHATQALSDQQLATAKQTFNEDVDPAGKESKPSRQPIA